MEIRQLAEEGLGSAAYLVISERARVAALIDPLRDVDRYLDIVTASGVRITHVFETHIHHDFVSGARELAARAGAAVCASAAAGLLFEHRPLYEGDIVVVGDIRFRVLATPGHTPEHISYVVDDLPIPKKAPVLFSGGSLLVGTVSRPDLVGNAYAAVLARALYHSLHDKLLRLPDETAVYPTHGFGPFCSTAPGKAHSTTIGQERRANRLLALDSVDRFVAAVLSLLPACPPYCRYVRAVNQRGPRILGPLPKLTPLTPEEVWARMSCGAAVVDLRPADQYLARHIPCAYHIELSPAFASWVGLLVRFGTAIILLSEEPDVLEEAVRQLVRIGYDDLSGYLAGGMKAWEAAGYPVVRERTASKQ